jgi:glycosyltransferase involved in cell wall biosynthesis
VQLGRKLKERLDRQVELRVVGAVPAKLAAGYDRQNPGLVNWTGVVHRDQVPPIDRAAHVLFSADLNAACPNSVIEALACGLPVVSFATGSLPELIEGDAGVVVPWGSNFWRLEPPDIDSLASAAARVIREQAHFRPKARTRAETVFGLDEMVEKYLDVMLG